MRLREKITVVVLAVMVCTTGGCGEDVASISSVAASLLIPRQLSNDLTTITVYAIETDKETHQPDCDLLLNNIQAYRDAKVVREKTVDFDIAGTTANIEKIPDRGRVWRFYARGYQDQELIAHGCDVGLREVPANQTIELTITLERTN